MCIEKCFKGFLTPIETPGAPLDHFRFLPFHLRGPLRAKRLRAELRDQRHSIGREIPSIVDSSKSRLTAPLPVDALKSCAKSSIPIDDISGTEAATRSRQHSSDSPSLPLHRPTVDDVEFERHLTSGLLRQLRRRPETLHAETKTPNRPRIASSFSPSLWLRIRLRTSISPLINSAGRQTVVDTPDSSKTFGPAAPPQLRLPA